jgi:hemerythrin HHE cation binding domain-containing protein
VLELLGRGCDYPEIGRLLGLPAGQAYLIGTGMPADGGDAYTDAERERPGVLSSAQHLLGPEAENPTGKDVVRQWLRARAQGDAAMQQAESLRDATPPEPADPDDVHDAITVLGRDHNRVKVLQKQLAALPGVRKGGSPAQLSARQSIVDMITLELSRHEAVEEEHFWPAVRRTLPDGDALADGALAQEQEGKNTLVALGKLEPDADEFDELVEQLIAALRQHVAYEEQVFLKVKAAMSADDLNSLGETLLSAKKRAPTRPQGGGSDSGPKKRAPTRPQGGGSDSGPMDMLRDKTGERPAQRRGKAAEGSDDKPTGR